MHSKENPDGAGPPIHRPVMGQEVVDVLSPVRTDSLLDVTVGTGGHARLVGKYLGPDGLLVGMDADEGALAVAGKRIESQVECRVRLFQGRFSEADEVLRQVEREGFDMILADLGVGTHQLDVPGRGFSFESDGALDMRFDPSSGRSAGEVVNGEREECLANIFFHLGGERFSRQIASEIGRRRRRQPIASARDLADIARKVYAVRRSGRRWRRHPATRIFMALRIYVNAEMEELDRLLELLPGLAAEGGRAAVITYHSLEARRVKDAWRRQKNDGVLELITPKPLCPSEQEVSNNPRARSAQLRAAHFF